MLRNLVSFLQLSPITTEQPCSIFSPDIKLRLTGELFMSVWFWIRAYHVWGFFFVFFFNQTKTYVVIFETASLSFH